MKHGKKSIWTPGGGLMAQTIRAAVRDHMTYDSTIRTHDAAGNMLGQRMDRVYKTHDGRTVDSTGAFLVGELERLDPELHMPLFNTEFLRDIDLREDVSVADEVSSYTISTFGSAGALGTGNGIGNGKSWIGKNSTQIAGIGVDIGKVVNPLTPWAEEIKFTIMELESSIKAGRPIDQQKFEGLKIKHQMDIDEQVYIGDTSLTTPSGANMTGLVNASLVTNVSSVAQGAGGSTFWANKTPYEILTDFNTALTSVWTASAFAVTPRNVLLPPTQYGYLSSQTLSAAGNTSVSILKYIQENNILTAQQGVKLSILPSKWCVGAGAGGTYGTINGHDRMVVYTKEKRLVRFPMTLLAKTPVLYQGMYQSVDYYCKLGVVETPYFETIGYFDLI